MPRVRASRAAGFSLIELLVVLAIMAVLAAGAPVLLSSLPGPRLRAAADDLVDRLRGLHDQAIRHGAATELTLDPETDAYTVSGDPSRHTLPKIVTGVDFQHARVAAPDRMVRVRFFPDGSATGGTVRLRHGEAEASVAIDWLTGRVRRE